MVINKIDTIEKQKLLQVIDNYRKEYRFAEVVPISAIKGQNTEELLNVIQKYLPEGPQYYGSDQVTDRPEYFVVAELIREQILHLTSQEVPHATAVAVDQMNQRVNGKLQIDATIYVERDGQKGILIGKGGKMLKEIGTRARKEIEFMLGDKVFLELWVKVQPNWKDRQVDLKAFGYRQDDY